MRKNNYREDGTQDYRLMGYKDSEQNTARKMERCETTQSRRVITQLKVVGEFGDEQFI